jgi:hypothetical protein
MFMPYPDAKNGTGASHNPIFEKKYHMTRSQSLFFLAEWSGRHWIRTSDLHGVSMAF